MASNRKAPSHGDRGNNTGRNAYRGSLDAVVRSTASPSPKMIVCPDCQAGIDEDCTGVATVHTSRKRMAIRKWNNEHDMALVAQVRAIMPRKWRWIREHWDPNHQEGKPHITCNELDRQIGLPATSWSRWETGKHRPPLEHAEQVGKALRERGFLPDPNNKKES